MAEIANHADNQPWPSLEWASWIFDRASFALVGSLVVGVVATIAIVWMGIVKEHHWDLAREHSAERIALLELETAKANEEIAKANEGAAQATARATEAQLALEKFKSPRVISVEQQAELSAALKKFGGTPFDLSVGPMGDPEPLHLSRSIHGVLQAAGWVQISWTGGGLEYNSPPMGSIGVTSVTNVIVDVHPDHVAKLGEAAKALAEALGRAGIDAITDSSPTTLKADAVHIRIGRKL